MRPGLEPNLNLINSKINAANMVTWSKTHSSPGLVHYQQNRLVLINPIKQLLNE